MGLLRFEKRPTSIVRVGQIVLGGVIVAALLHVLVSEVALRDQWSKFDDERISLSLRSSAADDYHDPAAVSPNPSLELREGLKPLTTDLRQGLDD